MRAARTRLKQLRCDYDDLVIRNAKELKIGPDFVEFRVGAFPDEGKELWEEFRRDIAGIFGEQTDTYNRLFEKNLMSALLFMGAKEQTYRYERFVIDGVVGYVKTIQTYDRGSGQSSGSKSNGAKYYFTGAVEFRLKQDSFIGPLIPPDF